MGVADYTKLEKKAQQFYDAMRSTANDIELISNNTGISKSIIKKIKNHVFMEEHLLDNGISRFAPDLEMVEAWKRLQANEFVQSDLLFLQHEYVESLIMSDKNIGWRFAHDLTNQIYDWNLSL